MFESWAHSRGGAGEPVTGSSAAAAFTELAKQSGQQAALGLGPGSSSTANFNEVEADDPRQGRSSLRSRDDRVPPQAPNQFRAIYSMSTGFQAQQAVEVGVAQGRVNFSDELNP